VNLGSTNQIAMGDLRAICERIGFEDVRTYIQSGNVVFRSSRGAASVQALLAKALADKMKAPVGVIVRTLAELQEALRNNPFPKAAPNRVIAFFLDKKPGKGALDGLVIPGREEVRLAGREIFVHYPDGQGRSKLKLPQAKSGTGRNMNTVAKLVEMTEDRR
jgi:uncharacterized protein (DUF1697 family)